MEFLLYIIGNSCCVLAVALLIIDALKKEARKPKINIAGAQQETPTKKEFGVSLDLQILCFFGSIARVYWSCSPPAVWENEPLFIRILSRFDVYGSPLVWGACLYFVGRFQHEKTPTHLTWPVLGAISGVIAILGPMMFSDDQDGFDSWPFAINFVVFNMVVDAMAMIPQMHHIAYSEDRASAVSHNFTGLLCIGRIFRVLFWACMLLPKIIAGGHYAMVWEFIVPDIIHTVLISDYLYLWLKKVKREKIDPLVDNMNFNV